MSVVLLVSSLPQNHVRRMRSAVSACGLFLCGLATLGGCTSLQPFAMSSQKAVTIDIDALWNFGNPAQSEERFRAAQQGATPDQSLELETQIARTYSLRGREGRALATLDAIEKKINPHTAEPVRVRLALERGRALRTPTDFEIARPFFQEAFDRATAASLTILAIDAAHMFGFSKDLVEAQRWNERALALANASELPAAIRWRSTLTHNMGVTERGRKNFPLALSLFRATEKAEEALNRPARMRIVRWQIGNTLRLMGNIDGALAVQLRIEDEAKAANAPDLYIDSELAELFALKSAYGMAKTYAARAISLAERSGSAATSDAALVARMREILAMQ